MRKTQTIEELKDALKEVCYVPHKKMGEITIEGRKPKERESDDTCVSISKGSRIDKTGNISFGRWVMIGAGCRILTHRHKLSGRKPLLLIEEEEENVVAIDKQIKEDVWIHESVILPQCEYIAKGTIIGTGSIVTKSITEEYTVWAGNPAKRISKR